MTSLEFFISDIKRDLMFHIILHMRRSELTLNDAGYLAKDFLNIFPIVSVEDGLQKLNSLGKLYKEKHGQYLLSTQTSILNNRNKRF